MKKLVVIAGPTAVGKTNVSIELANILNTEIVSCDSRQMYKEMSIGTAVPSPGQLKKVKHHFIQNISIHDSYSAYKYEVDCINLLQKLFEKHPIVIMTGGSGLYIDAVINGIDDIPSIEAEVRKELENRLKTEGLESLRIELKRTDPKYYNNTDLKNPKRILKALEVFQMTGKPYSSFLTKNKKTRNFDIEIIGINRNRTELHQRINKRVDEMVQTGLINEAKQLYPLKKLNSLNTVGYKELFNHFDGETSLETAIELIKRNTRRYARRQITWFKRYNKIKWYEPDETEQIYSKVTT